MPDQYELTIDGLAAAELVPFQKELAEIAQAGGGVSINSRGNILIEQSVSRASDDSKDETREKATERITEGGFEVTGSRIIPLYFDWGNEARYAEDDVKELSERHPDKIFYLLTVTVMEKYAEIETLENFQRQRFQAGRLTGHYDAEPIVWNARW